MSEYVCHMDECALALPREFVDNTLHNFEWMGPEGRRALSAREVSNAGTFRDLVLGALK